MKKMYLLFTVVMVAVLCLAGTLWADEASVFDSVQKIIIRAYTVNTGTTEPVYSAYLNVRDSNGDCVPSNKLVVTPLPTGNPLTPETEGPYKGDYKIVSNLSLPDFSISFDNDEGITYIICTNASVDLLKYHIVTLLPVDGVCGSSNGQAFTTAPSANLCSVGTASAVTGSGPWNWTCSGVNGGNQVSCSARVQAVNGQCGSSNGGTFTSAPSTNLCSVGTASAVTGSGPWNWTCAGTGGGTTATCSANAPSSGHTIDLAITSFSAASGVRSGSTWSSLILVKNNSSNAAQAFTVKYYQGSTMGTLVGSVDVSGLDAGATTAVSYAPILYIGAHVTTYITVVIEPNSLDTDTVTSNNSSMRCVTGY